LETKASRRCAEALFLCEARRVGLHTFLAANIDLLVGPVWFNDPGRNGKMKWTTQIDVNF
jgi:hypothetical protein